MEGIEKVQTFCSQVHLLLDFYTKQENKTQIVENKPTQERLKIIEDCSEELSKLLKYLYLADSSRFDGLFAALKEQTVKSDDVVVTNLPNIATINSDSTNDSVAAANDLGNLISDNVTTDPTVPSKNSAEVNNNSISDIIVDSDTLSKTNVGTDHSTTITLSDSLTSDKVTINHPTEVISKNSNEDINKNSKSDKIVDSDTLSKTNTDEEVIDSPKQRTPRRNSVYDKLKIFQEPDKEDKEKKITPKKKVVINTSKVSEPQSPKPQEQVTRPRKWTLGTSSPARVNGPIVKYNVEREEETKFADIKKTKDLIENVLTERKETQPSGKEEIERLKAVPKRQVLELKEEVERSELNKDSEDKAPLQSDLPKDKHKGFYKLVAEFSNFLLQDQWDQAEKLLDNIIQNHKDSNDYIKFLTSTLKITLWNNRATRDKSLSEEKLSEYYNNMKQLITEIGIKTFKDYTYEKFYCNSMINCLSAEIGLKFKKSQFKEAVPIVYECIDVFNSVKDKQPKYYTQDIIKLQENIAVNMAVCGRLLKDIVCLEKAVELLEELNVQNLSNQSVKLLGMLYYTLIEIEKANNNLQKEQEYTKKEQNLNFRVMYIR